MFKKVTDKKACDKTALLNNTVSSNARFDYGQIVDEKEPVETGKVTGRYTDMDKVGVNPFALHSQKRSFKDKVKEVVGSCLIL